MRRQPSLVLVLLIMVTTAASLAQDTQFSDLRSAENDWSDGNYIAALTTYIKLLNSPSGDKYLEPIALQTGELFVTEELTTDGRNPSLSRDGRLIAFETGPAKSPVTRIERTEGTHTIVLDLPGTGAVFSPDASKVAYIKASVSDELTKAQEALDQLTEQGPERTFAQQTLTRLQSKLSTIVLHDLKTGVETELKTGDLLKATTLAFGVDNESVYFVGGKEDDPKRNDIYVVTASASAPGLMTDDAEGFKTAPFVGVSGKAMIVSLPNQTPFPVPQPPSENRGGQGQRGQRGGGARGGAPAKFGVVDLATHKMNVVMGSAPVFSEDGNVITYISTDDTESSLMMLPIGRSAATVFKSKDRIAAPAFSPDGKRIVYQKMVREDWEIFFIGIDGKDETRVTRDIQHDVVPQFLSKDRILAASGEPRHRRSFIYDIPSMRQIRLFHNNTVRTIAPEYSWMPTPDGSKILISAERDGDTISPERGVYLVDLNRKVTKKELNNRLQKELTSETLLREYAQKVFDPISESVRKVLADVSTSRIFEYEKALVSFDSRHVSMPGNKKAIEYLTEKFKSFGYEPEQQWFEARGALDGKSANVIARLPGTENPELIYTLSSHLDSVVAGPGADDDASGIAALLEAARVLRAHPMPATIIFACFTGEESGTLGSREFARIAKEGKWKVAGSLNNDMVGYANDSRLDNTIRYSNVGIRDIEHSAAIDFTKLITYDAHYYKGTDAAPLFGAFGDVLGGIGGYPVLSSPHYHQASDVLETLNFQQIAETSKMTVATLMYLASSPAPVKDLTIKGSDVSWAPSPEKSVRGYMVSYGKHEERVSGPRIVIPGLKSGDVVMVRAVNARGMPGWDWSRGIVPEKR
jgi:Peptidase family M28/WD40-like Beta Propeller Repeat